MSIVVRRLKEKDFKATIETILDSINGSFPKVRPKELLPYFCEKYNREKFIQRAENTTMFIAVDTETDEVAGVIGLKDNQLRTFYVKTSCQRKGIGRLLYERLEQEAKNQGTTKIVLEGSPFGVPAYKKFGFAVIQEKQKERFGYRYSDSVMEKLL